MNIDQEWVIDNIDKIMKEFLIVHPEFKNKDKKSQRNKSFHRKKMLEDMNTLTYRPIYYIAKTCPETKANLRMRIKHHYNEWKDCEKCLSVWKSNHDYMKARLDRVKNNLEEEYGTKSYEYQLAFPEPDY